MQLPLDRARKPKGRGGWRPGAGRKKKPGAVSHDTRPQFQGRFPQHVTIRTIAGAPSLARAGLMKIIRQAIQLAHKPDFRVVEFNVLSNHLHLVCEATNAEWLARGVQGLEVRIARRVNAKLGRTGKLFAARYHARSLTTPAEVRNCLRYVLLNRKHHASEKRFAKYWIDPCSSAAWFSGWAQPIRADEPYKRELRSMPRPTAPATVWLLTTGWHRHHGRLRFDESPA